MMRYGFLSILLLLIASTIYSSGQATDNSCVNNKKDSILQIIDTAQGRVKLDAWMWLFIVTYESDADFGINCTKEMGELADELNDHEYYFLSKLFTGYCYRNQGKIDSALIWFEKALDYACEVDLPVKTAISKMEYQQRMEESIIYNELLEKIIIVKQRNIKIMIIVVASIFCLLVLAICFILSARKKNNLLFDKIQKLTLLSVNQDTIIENIETVSSVGSGYTNGDLINNETKQQLKDALASWINEEGFLKPVTLSDMAKDLKTNQKYLASLIKEKYDKNFNDFINNVRINYILRKLQTDSTFSKYSIDSLSKLLGYKSRSTFYKVFREQTGLTPSFYISRLT